MASILEQLPYVVYIATVVMVLGFGRCLFIEEILIINLFNLAEEIYRFR